MLKDMLGEEQFKLFQDEYKEYSKDKMRNNLQTGDDSDKSLIKDKVLSKRLKSSKTRGQLEELNDYNEIISDDEDETNLNDYDALHDHEEDILSDDDGNQSEDDDAFKKLEKNIGSDLANKEYEVPKKEKTFDKDSDDEDDGDIAWTISDDDDDDEDDD